MQRYNKLKQIKMKKILMRKTNDSKTYLFSIKITRTSQNIKRLSLKLMKLGNTILELLSVISIEK